MLRAAIAALLLCTAFPVSAAERRMHGQTGTGSNAPSESEPPPRRELWPETLVLSLGFVGSASFIDDSTVGLELSLPWFKPAPIDELPHGVGPVFQWQRLHGDDRYMAGVEYANVVGVELGWVGREIEGRLQHGLHVVLFASIGVVSLGPKLDFFPGSDSRVDFGLNFYIKIPVLGDYPLNLNWQ